MTGAAVPAALCRNGDARLPAERLQRRHIGEETLAAAIDEDLAGEAVPEPIERQEPVIDLRSAAILLVCRVHEARHQPDTLGERWTEPAHEAALAKHILETEPISGRKKRVDAMRGGCSGRCSEHGL